MPSDRAIIRTWQARPKEQIIDEVIARLSAGEPLAQVCRDPRMPSIDTIYYWREQSKEFSARFGQARDAGFDQIALDALHIADDGRNDFAPGEDGKPNFDHIQRSKLRVETRLKLLSKWDPRRYGDRVQTEHSGSIGIAELIESVHRDRSVE